MINFNICLFCKQSYRYKFKKKHSLLYLIFHETRNNSSFVISVYEWSNNSGAILFFFLLILSINLNYLKKLYLTWSFRGEYEGGGSPLKQLIKGSVREK